MPENGDAHDDLSPDELYDLLSTDRRRHIIRFTAAAAATGFTPISPMALARGIAAVEMGLPVATEEKARTVYSSITQDRDHRPSELSRLGDAGVLDYDDTYRNKTVAPGPNFARTLAAMDAFEGVFAGRVHFETGADSDTDSDNDTTEDGGVDLPQLTKDTYSDGGARGILIRA